MQKSVPQPIARPPAAYGGSLRPYLAELRPLFGLAVPLIISLAVSTLMGSIDTYMLGDYGETVLAAVSLTSAVLLIFFAGLYGLMQPVSILAGQAFGAGQPERIPSIVRHGVLIALAAGALSAAAMVIGLPLLATSGQPPEVIAIIESYWLPMSVSLIPYTLAIAYKQMYDAINRPWLGLGLTAGAVGLNIVLNWLLIDGQFGLPALGMTGAGIASLIAQSIGVIAFILHYRLAPGMAAYRGSVKGSWRAIVEQLREGGPIGLQYLAEGGAVAVIGILIGYLGATQLAANQIVYSTVSLLYMLPLGMAGAVGILVSQAEGAGERDRVRAITWTALTIAAGWAALFTVGLLFAGNQVAGLFVDDPDVIAVAAAGFVVVGVMQVFDGLQSVSLGALRGMLDTRYPTVVSLIGYWLLAVPIGMVGGFVMGWGVAGMWGGFMIGLAVAAFLLIRRLRVHFRAVRAG